MMNESDSIPSLSGTLDIPLADLPQFLQDRTTELHTLGAVFARYSDASAVSDVDRALLNDITSGLGALRKRVANLEREKHRLLHEVECGKVDVSRLRLIRDRLKEQAENVPPHMPQNNMIVSTKADRDAVKDDKNGIRKRGNVQFAEPELIEQDKTDMPPPQRMLKRCDPSKLLSKTKKTKLIKTTVVPIIDYLTTDEFKSLPKYMLGRVKYEQINSLIDEINSCASQKYKIIDTPLNKLSSENMKKFNRMTDTVETKETRDKVWFESQDIKDFASSVQVVHNFTKILPILRHCQRLRQFRAGKIEKYVII